MAQMEKPAASATAEDVCNEFVNKVKGINGVVAILATVCGEYIALTTVTNPSLSESNFDEIAQAELEIGQKYDDLFLLEFHSFTFPPSQLLENYAHSRWTKILYRKGMDDADRNPTSPTGGS